MRAIGFSTGSLAFGDFERGLAMVHGKAAVNAVELSALRQPELVPLVGSLDRLDLRAFVYVSVHAPSRMSQEEERAAIVHLRAVAERRWPIIIHPDAIHDWSLWGVFGEQLLIENMDKRKQAGRTAQELSKIFVQLPAASLCFDLGHARQVDPTMTEATLILKQFRNRIKQLHVSDVDSESKHDRLSFESVLAFQKVADFLPENVPAILETPVQGTELEEEVKIARQALSHDATLVKLQAAIASVFSSKTRRRHRLTAFLDTLRFAHITLYDVDLVISRLPIGEPFQKGNAFLNPFDLYSVLPDFEKRELNEYYFGLVRRIEAEDAGLARQFPEQFRHSRPSNRVGGRIAVLGGDRI
jgi:hypothetical protein